MVIWLANSLNGPHGVLVRVSVGILGDDGCPADCSSCESRCCEAYSSLIGYGIFSDLPAPSLSVVDLMAPAQQPTHQQLTLINFNPPM
mmetsp:Transcript_23795/g.36609  ORF Transcript_23795/g.36609 Transcript_23795/m.36609 type:complete len:88 (+) Transcript_23795:1508-1771(+)